MNKIKISAVSYLNSKPFTYGIEHHKVKEECVLELDIPSVCAQKLLEDKVDIGLIPVAVIPKLQEAHIITDYCIGAVGAVSSVVLYSNVPLNEIRSVYLDYQSRTSVALTRVLAAQFWKIDPEWIPAAPGFENAVEGSAAAVIIGDRTFGIRDKFRYAWDLSEEWMKFTGLPFVFACWVANKKLPPGFIDELNAALAWGIERRVEVGEMLQGQYPAVDTRDYLGEKISYRLDEAKRKGLEKFLGYLGSS
jgi:chorismate dehydratase